MSAERTRRRAAGVKWVIKCRRQWFPKTLYGDKYDNKKRFSHYILSTFVTSVIFNYWIHSWSSTCVLKLYNAGFSLMFPFVSVLCLEFPTPMQTFRILSDSIASGQRPFLGFLRQLLPIVVISQIYVMFWSLPFLMNFLMLLLLLVFLSRGIDYWQR